MCSGTDSPGCRASILYESCGTVHVVDLSIALETPNLSTPLTVFGEDVFDEPAVGTAID